MIEIITYNLQRHRDTEGVRKTIDAVGRLMGNHPNALLCLQEVSSEVSLILGKHHHVKSGENMIVAPSGWGLLDESTIPSIDGSRSFLTCRFSVQRKVFTVVTGKLPHGISPAVQRKRRHIFSRLLEIFPSSGLLMALDTNAFFPREREKLTQLAEQHHLLSTSHPGGTYDLGLLEPKDIVHRLAGLVGRVVPIRPELDFIFYDSSLICKESHVIDAGNVSDHKPVLACFNQ